MSKYGFPFRIFHEDFQLIPYAPVNQFDIMKSKRNFIAGATNSLYLRNPPFEGTLAILNVSYFNQFQELYVVFSSRTCDLFWFQK